MVAIAVDTAVAMAVVVETAAVIVAATAAIAVVDRVATSIKLNPEDQKPFRHPAEGLFYSLIPMGEM